MKCGCGGHSSQTKRDGAIYVDTPDPPYYQLTGELLFSMTCDKCGGSVGGSTPAECEARWIDTQKHRKRHWSKLSAMRYEASRENRT